MSVRVGQGYDIHRLVEGRRLVLGGIEIPSEVGLDGFSDADVVLHALGDAILGAAALGDLGTHFPPGDEAWRDADSTDLLRKILAMASDKGLVPVNCDVTLIGERPRLGPHRERMTQSIAGIMGLPIDRVGVKATTNEGLGTLGRGEGLAALAVVLLEDSGP